MTEPKFTPGPWHVEVEVDPEDVANVYICHPGTVCDVTVVATMSTSEAIEHDQKILDAELIAAAPDLYQALYNVMLEFGPGTMSDAAFEGACVALAKARGETIDVNALAD